MTDFMTQVLGTVPTISVEKTDGCQMYLSQDSLAMQLITAQSSEMNLLLPAGKYLSTGQL
jgi:adenylyl cyclase-associated protein